MKHRRLGRTGLDVPELCLGTMTFGFQCDRETSFAIMDRAFESGIDFFDTANVYPLGGGMEAAGRTEEIIGAWTKERGTRDRVLLATKCFGPMQQGENQRGLSRLNIQRAIEGSLRRMQTDVIDLYQTHHQDPSTPIDETLRALDDLVRAGKVRYIGCSNYSAWRVSEALATSARLGLARFDTLQPRYNMLYREIENEVLPLAQDAQLGVLVYNPIAGGMLAGKYAPGDEPKDGTRFTLGSAGEFYKWRYWHERTIEVAAKVAAAAREVDLDPAAVAVAWVLGRRGVTSAIVGASRPDHLSASLKGMDLKLDDDLQKLCNEVWFDLPRRKVVDGYI